MDKLLGKRKVGESSRPRIVYPRPPVDPFKSIPIVELPNTPQRLEFYIAREFEEEKNKLWDLHVELKNQYEEKHRKTILYQVDKIDWPAFYEKLVKILEMWNEIRSNEDILKPIVKELGGRDRDTTLLCISIITLSCEQIERTFDITNGLSKFNEKRVAV